MPQPIAGALRSQIASPSEIWYTHPMCGRSYSTYTDAELMFRYFNKRPVELPKFGPNYNTAPTQVMPIITMSDDGLQVRLARWGLIPAWAKDVKSASSILSSTLGPKRFKRSAVTRTPSSTGAASSRYRASLNGSAKKRQSDHLRSIERTVIS